MARSPNNPAPKELKSAIGTLLHAQRRSNEFLDKLTSWFAQRPFRADVMTDEVTGDSVVKVFLTVPFPEDLEHDAADITRSLRAALDQAAYAVSDPTSKRRNTSFPFAMDLAKAQARGKKGGGSNDILPEFFDLMIGFKPYPATHATATEPADGDTPLSAIWLMRNDSDHKFIFEINFKQGAVVVGGALGPLFAGMGLATISNKRWDRNQTETELFRVPRDEPVPDGHIKEITATFGTVVADRPMDYILPRMLHVVDMILI